MWEWRLHHSASPCCWAPGRHRSMGQMNSCVHENACQCESKANFHPMELFKDLLAFFLPLLPQKGVEWDSEHLWECQVCSSALKQRGWGWGWGSGREALDLMGTSWDSNQMTFQISDWKYYFNRFSIQEHSPPVTAFHMSSQLLLWQLRSLQYFMPQSQLLSGLQ